MVFHFRCFSSLLEEEDEDEYFEYDTITQTKSTTTFYTAASDFNKFVSSSHAKPSEVALRVFTYDELKVATCNFCKASKIAKSGFGTVYKGVISFQSLENPFDKILVAVMLTKKLQGWEPDIKSLGVVKHPNLVELIGYCVERDIYGTRLLLVYEYMVNRSVKSHLYGKLSKTPLSWNKRLKIAQDVARGLTYLHQEMDFQVILRDFKTSNVLLDDQWNAKLADFGSALLHSQQPYTLTSFVGTKAYAAPECITLQVCTSKSDVWSYGVFLYELITGRRPMDKNRPQNEQKLLEWVKPYLEPTRFKEIVDPRLEGNYQLKSAQMLSNIANKCLFEDPKSRPKMNEVLRMINQVIKFASQPSGPPDHIKTSNDDKKDSIGNQRRLPSCFCCFNKKRNA